MDNLRKKFNKLRSSLLEIKGTVCVNCQKDCGTDIIFHHVVPLAVGGTNNISNIVPVCETCDGLIHNIDRINWKALQREGIEKAKQKGKYTGRAPRMMEKEKFINLLPLNLNGQRTAVSICEELKISANTFYRWKKEYLTKKEQ